MKIRITTDGTEFTEILRIFSASAVVDSVVCF